MIVARRSGDITNPFARQPFGGRKRMDIEPHVAGAQPRHRGRVGHPQFDFFPNSLGSTSYLTKAMWLRLHAAMQHNKRVRQCPHRRAMDSRSSTVTTIGKICRHKARARHRSGLG
jgi:hypothetical protein